MAEVESGEEPRESFCVLLAWRVAWKGAKAPRPGLGDAQPRSPTAGSEKRPRGILTRRSADKEGSDGGCPRPRLREKHANPGVNIPAWPQCVFVTCLFGNGELRKGGGGGSRELDRTSSTGDVHIRRVRQAFAGRTSRNAQPET